MVKLDDSSQSKRCKSIQPRCLKLLGIHCLPCSGLASPAIPSPHQVAFQDKPIEPPCIRISQTSRGPLDKFMHCNQASCRSWPLLRGRVGGGGEARDKRGRSDCQKAPVGSSCSPASMLSMLSLPDLSITWLRVRFCLELTRLSAGKLECLGPSINKCLGCLDSLPIYGSKAPPSVAHSQENRNSKA